MGLVLREGGRGVCAQLKFLDHMQLYIAENCDTANFLGIQSSHNSGVGGACSCKNNPRETPILRRIPWNKYWQCFQHVIRMVSKYEEM